MPPELAIKTRIAQIKASGKVASPNTWIGTTSITKKNGKRYTYYRLMKTVPISSTKDNPNPSSKTKMVQYLGSADSEAYQEMKEAIARRNEIKRLLRQLKSSKQLVSADKFNKQPTLTTLVMELMVQVQNLSHEINTIKLDLERRRGEHCGEEIGYCASQPSN